MVSYLEIENLTKRYDGVTAVDDVSLSIEEGEFFALLGPSGCGKTTTLRTVAGLVSPNAGRIVIGGKDITHAPPRARNLGMVFQSYALFPHLNVFENVAFGLRLQHLKPQEIQTRIEEALGLVQLVGMERRFPRQLSGGQQQRVALARAIVVRPRVLLFDEPLSNLDAKLRERMRDDIRSLQRQLGITAVYVTHDQSEALVVADRIAVVHQGRVQQIGTPTEIYEHPANQFVAEFIGQTNLLTGRIESRDQVTVLVLSDNFQMRLGSMPGVHEGEKITIAVRPERIRLVSTSDANFNQTQGRVAYVRYLGSQIQYSIMIGELRLLVNSSNLGGQSYNAGEFVGVEIHGEDCIVLPN